MKFGADIQGPQMPYLNEFGVPDFLFSNTMRLTFVALSEISQQVMDSLA